MANQSLQKEIQEKEDKIKEMNTKKDQQETDLKNIIDAKKQEIENLEGTLEEQKKEMGKVFEEKTSQIEEMKTEKDSLQQELDLYVRSNRATLKNICKDCGIDRKQKFNEDTYLLIDYEMKKFLTEISKKKIRLTNIDCINFEYLEQKDPVLINLFRYSFPNKLKQLHLNTGWETLGGLKMSGFIDSLSKVIGCITCEVLIRCIVIDQKDLELILNSSKCETLCFPDCNISCMSVPSITNTTLKYLSFEGCGGGYENEWEKDERIPMRILKGIAKSPMNESLKKLDIYSCGQKKEWFEQVSKDLGIKAEIVLSFDNSEKSCNSDESGS